MTLKFITTGCSFTAGVIPLPHDNLSAWETQGSVWPHFCFSKMRCNDAEFINLALPGGGNVAAMNNLVYLLETEKQRITPDNTIIGINLTGLGRVDIITDLRSDKVNNDLACINPTGIEHPNKRLGFGWITHGNFSNVQQAEILSCLSVLQCFSYLELHNFKYFFMLMNSPIYTHAPAWFQQVLDSRKDNWVTFGNEIGMAEFAKKSNLLGDSSHPSTAGHKLISSYVMDLLTQKKWIDCSND